MRDESRRAGAKVHCGRIVELYMERGIEMPKGHELRKYKGRAVFQGGNVRDEYFSWAEFAELSSNPPSMEASRAADAVGSLDGYRLRYGDALGAYTQSYLLGVDTWVALLENRWPKHRPGKNKNPLVPLILALYGHPHARGRWEAHCEVVLLVYVDDFNWPRDGSTQTSSGRHSGR